MNIIQKISKFYIYKYIYIYIVLGVTDVVSTFLSKQSFDAENFEMKLYLKWTYSVQGFSGPGPGGPWDDRGPQGPRVPGRPGSR